VVVVVHKATTWERICWRRIYKLFVSTPQNSPIGGTIIEVKSALQLQEVVVCNEKLVFVVESGPDLQP
jgi:hypothetical protein